MRRVDLSGRAEALCRLVLLGYLLTGCAAPAALRLGLKLSPASLGESISLQQRLTVQRGDRIDQLDAALEVDEESVHLIILMLGRRMLSLVFDGQAVETWRDPAVPAQLRAEDVLEDLQLTLWPADAIRSALPPRWRIEERGLRRVLSFDAAPVIVIDYDGPSRWSDNVKLTNLRYGYRITIQSVTNPS
jgi:hypothetical protein